MKSLVKKTGWPLGMLILAAICFYFTPHVALWRMGKAAERGDSASYMTYVDFPIFRANLRTNISAAFLSKRSTNAQIAAVQTFFLQQATDKAVEEQLTPEKLTAQMMATARTNAQTRTRSTSRYLDFNTFAVDRDSGKVIFIRHGIATWKLSRIDGMTAGP